MTENEFLLCDRIQKIKSINEKYDLNKNAYLSFSGGKDSAAVFLLLNLALPNNTIPKVFINTGLENPLIKKYVKEIANTFGNVVTVAPKRNIKEMLNTDGYPFKSKQHSINVSVFQNSGYTKTVKKY